MSVVNSRCRADANRAALLLNKRFHSWQQSGYLLQTGEQPYWQPGADVRQIPSDELCIQIWIDKENVPSRQVYDLPDFVKVMEDMALPHRDVGRSDRSEPQIASGLI